MHPNKKQTDGKIFRYRKEMGMVATTNYFNNKIDSVETERKTRSDLDQNLKPPEPSTNQCLGLSS